VNVLKLPANRVSSTGNETILPKELAQKLRSSGVTCLRPIVSWQTRESTGFEELLAEAVLPKFAPETRGYEFSRTDPPCPACKRSGYYGIPDEELQLVYRGVAAEVQQRAVLETWERWGISRLREKFSDSRIAGPVQVVSDRVAEILGQSKGVEFVPVTFLD
jgi:hypothetical protein